MSNASILRALSRHDDWRSLSAADVLYVCHDADRTSDLAGRKYSPVIDTIQDALSKEGLRGLTIAAPYSVQTGTRAHGRVLGFNRSFARGRVPRFLGGAPRSGVDTWTRILSKVQPRGVIAVQPSRGLCEAGTRAGVWVADAQHGWIPSSEYPGEPYYTSRYWSVNGDGAFPDYFLVWDDASAQNLRRVFAPRPVKALRIGNMWCERFGRRDSDDPVTRAARADAPAPAPRILVTLQWKTVAITDTLPPELQRVIRKTCARYEWMIRLHPCHTDVAESAAMKHALHCESADGRGGVTWHAPSEMPLPALLGAVDLHLTYNSSSALEASYFGVTTGFVDRRDVVLRSGMAHLFEQRLAEVIPEDASAIEAWIDCRVAERRQRTRAGPTSSSCGTSLLMSLFR